MWQDAFDALLAVSQEQVGHFVSATCAGVMCRICGQQATHKIGEEQGFDDTRIRHTLTAYVCCEHFTLVMGAATGCAKGKESGLWT